jgi:hypothetical protein
VVRFIGLQFVIDLIAASLQPVRNQVLAVNLQSTYNNAMVFFLLSVLAYSTQNEALFAGSVPENVPTFQVTVRGSQPFYAGVRVNGKWIDDASTEIAPRQEVELVPDAPWQAQETYRFLRSKVEMKYEANAMRRDRLHKALAAQGYSLRDTANGWRPVRDSDVQYAERMRKMQAASRQAAAGAGVPESMPTVAADGPADKTMARRLFFAMVAIPVVCMAAIAFVAKKTFFDGGHLQKV